MAKRELSKIEVNSEIMRLHYEGWEHESIAAWLGVKKSNVTGLVNWWAENNAPVPADRKSVV